MEDATRASLLIRIRNPQDTEAWAEFYELYAPLLYRYARARGLSHEDAEDVRSNCYEAIARQIRHFKYDKERGGFKAWLRTMVNRRVVDRLRRRRERLAESGQLREIPSDEPQAEEIWEQQWQQQHLRYCIEQVRGRVSPQSFAAFQMLARDGARVPEVCEKLGMNRNQVYKAKARVLELVRQTMASLYSEAR